MERPTIEITLPLSGVKVTLYAYLTMRESRNITRKAVANIKADIEINKDDPKSSRPVINGFDATVQYDLQEEVYKSLVRSVTLPDGSVAPDPIAYLDEVPSADGDLLFAKIDEISNASTHSSDAKKN